MTTQTMDHHRVKDHSMSHSQSHESMDHYSKFAIMIGLSFIAMYVFMYSMVDAFSSVYNSVNQFYMAGVMAAPMVIIEILVMNKMYHNKKLNALILGGSLAALIFFFAGIRYQIGVGDKQFLRSMIPHHSGAVLMCNEGRISDPEIVSLCKNIIASQTSEIDQMKGILSRLDGK